ncbi:hypothetical protein ACFFRR_003880 [Megaselia abdita]
MALSNFTLPFGGLGVSQAWGATVPPIQYTAVNNLVYGSQNDDQTVHQEYYKNSPYTPPAPQRTQSQYNDINTRRKVGNTYLPPPLPSSPPSQPPTRNYQQRTYGETNFVQQPTQVHQQAAHFNGYNTQTRILSPTTNHKYPQQLPADVRSGNTKPQPPPPQPQQPPQPTQNINDPFPERPPGFTHVRAGQGSRTQVHAVLDYDVDEGDYYDQEDEGMPVDGKKGAMPTVTPIQGPIFLKNGTVPVVPLFSYPTINNGTFVQIPIWWTALSVALGLDVRGDVIKGVPCIKRYHQLFCPTAGNSYPIDKIERFIDDNKALMRRMYGDFEMNMDSGGPPTQQTKRKRRFIDDPDHFLPPGAHPAEYGESFFGNLREKRQAKGPSFNRGGNAQNAQNGPGQSTGRLDACESKIEIVTPYWASNSAGKIRAIVNTQHFEQAIHQEICT